MEMVSSHGVLTKMVYEFTQTVFTFILVPMYREFHNTLLSLLSRGIWIVSPKVDMLKFYKFWNFKPLQFDVTYCAS